ncbi:MAG TPA: hypothetical protein DEP60_05965 [Ruminococcaceae bacterium]|nr:hypothetical protein [Oscillospiraceae bacterium]
MQSGYVLKSALEPEKEDLAKINRYTRRPFAAEEVYTFKVVLCDNEVDRDGERFASQALQKLAELFRGKSGIFNHSMDAATQSARIYDTTVETDNSRKTSCGEPYTRLVAKAYMPRTQGNQDLILEIDSGIKKEVSVGCSVGSAVCSICGADRRRKGCGHVNGQVYHGQTCCTVLSDPQDAYEWSFVAVPAQREAGVTKSWSKAAGKFESEDAVWGRKWKEKLTQETAKYFTIAYPGIAIETARKMAQGLSPEELEQVEKGLRAEANRHVPLEPQLAVKKDSVDADEGFRI